MKKLIVVPALCLLIAIIGGCSKKKACNPVPPSSEAGQMQTFATANSINYTTHPSGLLYEIVAPGSGPTANLNSKIFITYTGKLLNGTVFDQQTTTNVNGWVLGGLIDGWKIGIPLIQKGGRIKLIIPSSLAYGCEPYNTLPGNSVLYFDITLVDVQ